MIAPGGAASAADAFLAAYGSAPAGVWSAPGRVNLIGEHTDYNRGLVLPFAIDRRTYCAAGVNTDGVIRVASAQESSTAQFALESIDSARFEGWTGYAAGVVWALGRRGTPLVGKPGIDIFIASEVPLGAGLSSSAALECAVASAVNELWGLNLGAMELAHTGQLAENEAVGAPTGLMDQVASLFGEPGRAVLLDCDTVSTTLVPLGLDAASLVTLVIDSRVAHRHADGGYRARRASCDQAAAALGIGSLRELDLDGLAAAQAVLDPVTFRRVRHVVTENHRVLATVASLGRDGAGSIGPLLLESHGSMRDDFEISVPEIDLIVDTAVGNGAVGARLTGGGFGGSAVALVPAECVDAVTAAVLEASEHAGHPTPSVLRVVPAQGARRED